LIRQGHDDAGRAREATAVHWRGYDHPHGAATLIRQMRSLRTRDTEAVGRRLAAELDASIDEVEGAKHFLPEDHPERLAAAVKTVLGAATR
jgi:pimeloyl-ACP methyl ester carboxylesterase